MQNSTPSLSPPPPPPGEGGAGCALLPFAESARWAAELDAKLIALRDSTSTLVDTMKVLVDGAKTMSDMSQARNDRIQAACDRMQQSAPGFLRAEGETEGSA